VAGLRPSRDLCLSCIWRRELVVGGRQDERGSVHASIHIHRSKRGSDKHLGCEAFVVHPERYRSAEGIADGEQRDARHSGGNNVHCCRSIKLFTSAVVERLRKSKRSAAIPALGSASKSACTTSLYLLPPCCGCGWQIIAAAQGVSGTDRSPLRATSSEVMNCTVRVMTMPRYPRRPWLAPHQALTTSCRSKC